MSDGVTAMFDRLFEEEHQRRLEKFAEHTDNAKLASVLAAINKLELFITMEPALTRHQWALLDDAVSELKDLVN